MLSGAPVFEGLGAIRDARSGWPTDSEGNPIYVFNKERPFHIRGQFNIIVPRDERAVQAAEAELAQKILQDFGHRTARLHLACAAWCSAPDLASGEYVRVSRNDIQDLLGVDRGTRPDLSRAERDAVCYREVENLKSVGVQIAVLSNARTENGQPVADYDRLRKLQSIWDLNIHEHGQAAIDFDGQTTIRGEDWQLLVRPTAWAELYVHSDAARQFGYFSRALLEEIDWHRKPAAGDLAIALLRYNKNQQGRPRDLTVKRMLEICQLDGAADRNTQYQHRNRLEAAMLEQERWGWEVEWTRWPEEYRPNQKNRRMPNGYWEAWQDWKVTFYPPRDLATATRRVQKLKAKPAPKKNKGSWGDRVDAILEETGWSQSGLADEIGVSKMSVSKWSRNESTPGPENQKAIRDLEQWLS